MKAYQITDIKDFMNKLLLLECFDLFLLEEGTIVTYNTFEIDGHIHKDFYTSEEQENQFLCPYDFSLWKDMRPLCFNLIKGKRTPLSFKFVLLLLPEYADRLFPSENLSDGENGIKAYTLTIKYDGSTVSLITGLSTATFLLNKSPEHNWDIALCRFMDKNQIPWEEI